MSNRRKKIRGRIRVRESVTLEHRADKTRVARPDTSAVAPIKRAPTQVPNNVPVFRVKLRKKK